MRNAIVILLILFFSITVKSQDIYFSQFDKTPLILNPANTGYFNGGHRLGVSYRSQWKNITTPYTTTSAFYDTKFLKKLKKDRMGIGLVFFNDKSGDVEMGLTQVSLSFSYSKLLSKENLFMFGIQAGYAQRSFDYLKATWDNQYNGTTFDPHLISGETNYNLNYSYADFAAGIGWGFRPNDKLRSTTGVALFHLSSPKLKLLETSKEGLYRKLVLHNKTEIYFNKSPLSCEPAFSYTRQGVDQQIIGGIMFRFTQEGKSNYSNSLPPTIFSLGTYYRTESAVILAARLNFNYFELNFSYDLNTSNLGKISKNQGGFEISISYIQFSTSKKRVSKNKAPKLLD